MGIKNRFASETFVSENIAMSKTELEERMSVLLKDFETIKNSIGIDSDVEPTNNDVPRIFINGNIPADSTEVLAEMYYYSRTDKFHAYIKIKCQGNSSLAYPKKNFTIKMYEDEERTIKLKKNIKGWGDYHKFVLKANWIDYSHARNVVSARIWSELIQSRSNYDELPQEFHETPNCGAIDGFPIYVYCNELYWGRYTWNLAKDEFLVNMDKNNTNHALLASENYISGCFRGLANIDETDWTDEIHDTVPENIKTSFNNAIRFVMESSNDDFVANIENYFDSQSLIDYYIFSYVICHLDGLGKNQLMYTYDGTRWTAGAYDMDSTFGLYWDGRSFVSHQYKMQSEYETGVNGTSNLLYERLENLFKEEIKERYNELRYSVLTGANLIQHFEKFLDLVPPYKCQEDYATSTAGGQFQQIPSTSTNNIGQIRQYIVKRLEYVDSIINSNVASSGWTTLRENFSPAGQSWMDTVPLNFNNGDYIEISVNLLTCINANENIISIGDSIQSWNQKEAGYHIYYTPSSSYNGTLQVNALITSNNNRKETTISSSPTIIKVASDGVYVNETRVQTNVRVNNLSNVQIGSMEGSTRSNAVYNYIKVFKNISTYND